METISAKEPMRSQLMVVSESSILQVQGAISFQTAQFWMAAERLRTERNIAERASICGRPFFMVAMAGDEVLGVAVDTAHLIWCPECTRSSGRRKCGTRVFTIIISFCEARPPVTYLVHTVVGLVLMMMRLIRAGDARWRLNFLAQQPWQLVSHSHLVNNDGVLVYVSKAPGHHIGTFYSICPPGN